jgi:putative transposase
MQLVERHIVIDNRFEDICLKSGLLYNYTLYAIRQGIFSKIYLNEYTFSSMLAKINQFDYRNLPAQVSQQVIKQAFQNIKSWIKANKSYAKNRTKFKTQPKLPKYKTGKKQNVVVFTNQVCRLKNGYIYFPKLTNLQPIKTNQTNFKQVRIIPQATCYVIEIIYEKEEINLNLEQNNILSLDLGLNNYVTTINNVGIQPFIINGKIMKSFNHWFNKKKAKLMSFVGNKGTSNKLKQLNNYRNFWIEDKNHKISRFIINYCIENNIGTIVIGKNDGWKNGINLGKKTNQKFVELPHAKLISKIEYKAKLIGINVITNEESYTSKTDNLALEPLIKQETYLGKRVKRGLFQSFTGKLINADVNGALGILRKVFDDSVITQIINSGQVFCPYRINIL